MNGWAVWRTFSLSFAFALCISTVYLNGIGDHRTALILCGVMGIMALIQLLVLRRVIKQHIQVERELLVRMLPEIEQAIDTIEQAQVAATRRRGLDTSTRAEMQRMQDEIRQAQQERQERVV